MAPSIFAIVAPSPLAGTLLRLSALGSIAIAGTKLFLAPATTAGMANQPLSDMTRPAKAQKVAFYQNASWFLAGALIQLKFSYTGIPSVLDKALYALLALQYASGAISDYSIGLTGPALAFAGSLIPMLGALSD